jgi:hypothetical protein
MHSAALNLSFVLALAFVPAAEAAREQVLPDTLPTASHTQLAHQDFLYAIRMVETGDVYNCKPGRLGEQGPYQFRREVWTHYTSAPFADARTPFADQVALEHYQWLAYRLKSNGLTPTPWRIAAAWNGGVEAVISGRVPRASRDYASRVVNLIEDQQSMRTALTPKYQIQLASVP